MKTRTFLPIRSVLLYIFMAATACTALAQPTDSTHQQEIRALISSTYDQPDRRVETTPIVVADNYAVADWTQGEKGGRALLRRVKEQWEIVLCGGDGLKEANGLSGAGVPPQAARKLATALAQAEQLVSPERRQRFGLFGTANDSKPTDHHHHNHQ